MTPSMSLRRPAAPFLRIIRSSGQNSTLVSTPERAARLRCLTPASHSWRGRLPENSTARSSRVRSCDCTCARSSAKSAPKRMSSASRRVRNERPVER